jgi:hypothetical protein
MGLGDIVARRTPLRCQLSPSTKAAIASAARKDFERRAFS